MTYRVAPVPGSVYGKLFLWRHDATRTEDPRLPKELLRKIVELEKELQQIDGYTKGCLIIDDGNYLDDESV